jgi:hypothetical protein
MDQFEVEVPKGFSLNRLRGGGRKNAAPQLQLLKREQQAGICSYEHM